MASLIDLINKRKEAYKYIDVLHEHYQRSYIDKWIWPINEYEQCIGVFNDDTGCFIECKNDHTVNINHFVKYIIRLKNLFIHLDSKECFIVEELYLYSPLNDYVESIFEYKFGWMLDRIFDETDNMQITDDGELTKIVTDLYLEMIKNIN